VLVMPVLLTAAVLLAVADVELAFVTRGLLGAQGS
jgi:hypothetical protein